eukprot:gene24638-13291_t
MLGWMYCRYGGGRLLDPRRCDVGVLRAVLCAAPRWACR